MALKKISKFLSEDPRYRRLQKPLEAAEICNIARDVAEGQYSIISFSRGLLTVSCTSTNQAAALQPQSQQIIAQINQKLGAAKVKKIRFKIGN